MMTREFIKQLRERKVDDGHVVLINRLGVLEPYNIYAQTHAFI